MNLNWIFLHTKLEWKRRELKLGNLNCTGARIAAISTRISESACPVWPIDISDFIFLTRRTRIASSAQDANVILTIVRILLQKLYFFFSILSILFRCFLENLSHERREFVDCRFGYLSTESVDAKNLSRISHGRTILIYVEPTCCLVSGTSETMLARMIEWLAETCVRISDVHAWRETSRQLDFFRVGAFVLLREKNGLANRFLSSRADEKGNAVNFRGEKLVRCTRHNSLAPTDARRDGFAGRNGGLRL